MTTLIKSTYKADHKKFAKNNFLIWLTYRKRTGLHIGDNGRGGGGEALGALFWEKSVLVLGKTPLIVSICVLNVSPEMQI